MSCPSCGTDPLPTDARFCPNCGRNLEPLTQIKIDQQVERNLGQVIGVQTEAIHGDVFGGDIYEVQVYALTDQGRQEGWQRFLRQGIPPYRYLSPYRVEDQPIFKGRERERAGLLQQIGQQRLTVVYGQPGVGKTSLLAAGVMPDLLENGAMAVHIHDPLDPVKSIRAALSASADQLPHLSLQAETLPQVVEEVVQAMEGSLVLVLDQFERLFEPSIHERELATLIESLSQSLHVVPPELYRLVIVVQESAIGHLVSMQDRMPELLRLPFRLEPLTPDQAQAAIQEPLVPLKFPVSFVGDLVEQQLVPDLDELSETPGIHPPHLQIVCHWLYRAASGQQPPHIDESLYAEAKGADGIIARHFEDVLRTQFDDNRTLAEQVLIHLSTDVVEHWVPRERLPRDGASPEQVRSTLGRLVEAELLIRRRTNGKNEYALASLSLGEIIQTLASPQADRQLRAEEELERVWAAWLARGVPATIGQLRFLDQAGDHLQPGPVRALLLLYSALSRDIAAGPWLTRLRTGQARALLRQLEGLNTGEGETIGSRSVQNSRSSRNKAGLLLGLQEPIQMERPAGSEELFGPLSWAAVKSADPVHRHTAALALAVIDPPLAIGRLDLALRAAWRGWALRLRAAELRGVLSDADPELEKFFVQLPLSERLAIWGWRARRRIFRDRHLIFWLTLGGAFGAGLSMGLLRAALAVLAGRMLVGAQFAINAFWGWILGAALSLGVVLGEPLLLGRRRGTGERPAIWRAPLHPDRLPGMVGILAGTLTFWLGHALVLAFSSLSPLENLKDPLRALTVALAGLGLSVALYGQPWSVQGPGFGRWLRQPSTALRMGIAGLAILVGDVVFLARNGTSSLVIAWGRDLYNSAFFNLVNQRFPQLAERMPDWPTILAYTDGVLIGFLLTIGITGGLYLALAWLNRWRELVERADD